MSAAVLVAVSLASLCAVALVVGLVRPAWVVPSRRPTRPKAVLLYSAAALVALGLAYGARLPAAHADDPQGLGAAPGEAPPKEALREVALRRLLGIGLGQRLRLPTLTVYYQEPISEPQAAAVGDLLRGFRLGGPEPVVQLRSDPGRAAFELRVATGYTSRAQIDGEARAAYQLLALLTSGLAFDGAEVRTLICDPAMEPLLTLRSPVR